MLPFSRKQFLPENDIGDLSGQVTLVTGGNSGFGKKTIFRLAKHNPLKIYMGARTVLKAREAIASIQDKLASEQSESAQSARPRTQIEFLEMDLASLASVKRAAECVVSTTDRLDLLILNTGIMATPASKTVDGFEVQMGTNHVGHFLLSKLLLDLLQHTATAASHDVRVVTVSSSGYMFAPSFDTMIDTDKLDNEGPWSRYGASKAANILFAAEWARRYPKITNVSLHPGVAKTGLFGEVKDNWWVRALTEAVGWMVYGDVETTARNQLYLARGLERDKIVNGAFYLPVGSLSKSNKWQTDEQMGKIFWEWTDAELKRRGY